MPVQIIIFFLLLGGVQGLLLLLFMGRNKRDRRGNLFLLLYLSAILLQVGMKVMDKGWLMTHWGIIYEISYYLPFVYGPLAWLFTTEVIPGNSFRPKYLVHFLPFAVLTGYAVMEKAVPVSLELFNFLARRDVALIFQLISLVTYHWHALENARDSIFSAGDSLPAAGRQRVRWTRQFIIASFIVSATVALAIYLVYTYHPRSLPYRYLFVALSFFIYWVSYSALARPSVFSVVTGNMPPDNRVRPVSTRLIVHRPAKKYANSKMTVEERAAILDAVQRVMGQRKPFLNPELNIDELASLVNCSRHRLSQALNETLDQSFYDFVNHHRVEQAMQLLTDESREAHKISSIAYDAGFNSLSTFNDVFKKVTGLTPSQYKKGARPVSKQERG